MSREEIFNRVKQILMSDFEVEASKINESSNLFTDLGLDSLDAIDLMVSLDKSLGVEANNEQAQEIRTVGETIDFVQKALKK